MSRPTVSSWIPSEKAELMTDIDDHYSEADQAALEERADSIVPELITTTEWWAECLSGINPTSSEVASQLARCMLHLDAAIREISRCPLVQVINLYAITQALSILQSNAKLDAREDALEMARDE